MRRNMMRKSIVFILILMLSFLQGWAPGTMMSIRDGFTQILHDELIRSAHAETKQSGTKSSPKATPKKGESTTKKKELVAPVPVAEKPDDFSFEVKEYPDGLIGRRYNFVPAPVNAAPPFKVSIVSGTLPPGINLNPQTGGVEGEPTAVGVYNVALRMVDSKGKKGTIRGDIRVWRSLTVGEHGQFKGFDGLQMALNMAKDMDEIRIEKGVYGGTGLLIPENKAWEHGIKISGGWNETFEEKNNDNKTTVLDGEKIENLDGEKIEKRILTIANSKGNVFIDNLTFRNSKGGAVRINTSDVIFSHCIFENNRASDAGGAVSVSGKGSFINCTFVNNSSEVHGGAVSGDGTFKNCIFTNNSSGFSGGAIYGKGEFVDCIFRNNSAGEGGAVYGEGGTFIACIFTENSAGREGGAINGVGTFINYCTFSNNRATERGGAIYSEGRGNVIIANNSIFENNSAKAGGGVAIEAAWGDATGTFDNCKFSGNSANKHGGGVYWGAGWGGKFLFKYCIFLNNKSASGNGGAVFMSLERGNISGIFYNSIFIFNEAYNGGGFYGNGTFINSTFYKNEAVTSGGAINGRGSIINSIFFMNHVEDISVDGNLDIDYSIVKYLKGAANFGDHNIMGNPKFVDPDSGDLHLRPDSPAINAGKITPELKHASMDIDGKPRIFGSKIDMGAYEWQGETTIESKPTSQTAIAIDATPGLQWAQDAGGQQMTWDEANDYVRKLRLGGYSDWRLPTKEELESLLSYCESKGILVKLGGCVEYYNKIGFKNVRFGHYWSSTSGANDQDVAWVVNMRKGFMFTDNKSISFYVWPVRSGQ